MIFKILHNHKLIFIKMKSLIIAGLLISAAGAAQAGPYVNIEANSGFVGNEYGGTAIDNHIGYEGNNWYIQGGPAALIPDGGDAELEFSGKVGASTALSEDVSLYGELSFLTGDNDTSYGTKAGVKWTF
mgnify:CR=1 FL=1